MAFDKQKCDKCRIEGEEIGGGSLCLVKRRARVRDFVHLCDACFNEVSSFLTKIKETA